MAKNIVICSDGTGNSAIKGRGTNVFKIFEAVNLHSSKQQQVAIYDDGVGTEKWKLLKVLGGAFGWGLSRNVKELYANLCRVYETGDRIYLFGFSRGAFTVRTLADFICSCGLLKPTGSDTEFLKQVNKTYINYRNKYRFKSLLGILFLLPNRILGRDQIEKEKFDKTVGIHFIGVWDTVDAVGLPFPLLATLLNLIYRYKFNNPALNEKVDRACHALAIDDERRTFSPTLWDDADRIEQVWFAGVHSNVGGGYPKQGMSLVALDWMMTRAEAAGLKFLGHDRERYHDHRNVNDKLYNSRAGLAVYYRYRPRNIHQICGDHNLTPKIHVSALARVAQSTEGYAPGNLPVGLKIVETLQSQNNYDDIEDQIREAHNTDESLLKRHIGLVRLRITAYYGFLIFSLWALAGYVCIEVREANPAFLLDTLKAIGTALANLLSWDGLEKLWGFLRENYWVLAGLVVSVAVGLWTRGRMHKVFSEFWYPLLSTLREKLK